MQSLDVVLSKLGLKSEEFGVTTGSLDIHTDGETLVSYSPVDANQIGTVRMCTRMSYETVIETASKAFEYWRTVPAPKRGEIVRQYGEVLREYKEPLGWLVSYEMGKIYQEGLGEVQEMIDICDFAVGLSRQLYGLTMHSERPKHRMYEQWHPLGICGVISAFNFPVAVWSWNAMLATVCGNPVIWKPSEKTPITALACHKLLQQVLKKNNLPEGLFNVIIGDRAVGEWLAADKRVPIVSATGSTRMGRSVGKTVAERFGRALLELGGNNAIILTEHADLKLAIPAILFGAIGTCGQRCTTTRRIFIHHSIYEKVKTTLLSAYKTLEHRIGNPLDSNILISPLIDEQAVDAMQHRLKAVVQEGGTILFGGKHLDAKQYGSPCYVVPALVEAQNHFQSVQEETFAPILYLMQYDTLDQAIRMQNDVPQGLSSAIFSNNIRETELYLSAEGSDCGIANVNIGTSGAEIGGAFGGEKETGGGRESGSDAWKWYMRRQTNTINFSDTLPLAQGIKFDI